MCLNLLYISPINRKTVCIELKFNENIEHLYQIISQKESIPENEFKLYSNGKRLETTKHLINDSIIGLHFGLNGGKGGFGSMLRAIGAQIEKTTNREACRDLTGRRLRDINEEKRIKEWIKKEKLRKEEIEEKRRQKLEKLTQKPKTEFNDLEFERTREEIPDIVEEALQYGLRVQQSEQSTSGEGVTQKRKLDEKTRRIKKKKISLLVGIEDIDDSDSDESEEEITPNITHKEKETNAEDKETIAKDMETTVKDTETTAKDMEDNEEKESTQNSEMTNDLKTDKVLKQSIEDLNESSNSNENTKKLIDEQNNDLNENKIVVSYESHEVQGMDCVSQSKPLDSNVTIAENSLDSKEVLEPLNLMDFQNVQQLEALGLDRLKHSLMALGLKCGGTLNERANRLWSIRGLNIKDIPKKLFAKKK